MPFVVTRTSREDAKGYYGWTEGGKSRYKLGKESWVTFELPCNVWRRLLRTTGNAGPSANRGQTVLFFPSFSLYFLTVFRDIPDDPITCFLPTLTYRTDIGKYLRCCLLSRPDNQWNPIVLSEIQITALSGLIKLNKYNILISLTVY